jgi:hypothetical protein
LLFVHGEAHAKSNRRCVERRSGAPLLFVRGATRIKSVMVRDVNQEPLADLYTLVR